MDVKSILLGFLMFSPMTGYDLKKFFNISFSFFSGLSYGSIYPSLKKMQEKDLVTVQTEVQDGLPNRKVYTITAKGREVFLHALKAPFELERQRSAFLTHLFFFTHLTHQERISKVKGYLQSINMLQEQLELARPQIEAHADSYQRLCFEFGSRFYQDLARNINNIIAALEAGDIQSQKQKTRALQQQILPASRGRKRK
jgi:DNA-binding PadR family transcriptional regulator